MNTAFASQPTTKHVKMLPEAREVVCVLWCSCVLVLAFVGSHSSETRASSTLMILIYESSHTDHAVSWAASKQSWQWQTRLACNDFVFNDQVKTQRHDIMTHSTCSSQIEHMCLGMSTRQLARLCMRESFLPFVGIGCAWQSVRVAGPKLMNASRRQVREDRLSRAAQKHSRD